MALLAQVCKLHTARKAYPLAAGPGAGCVLCGAGSDEAVEATSGAAAAAGAARCGELSLASPEVAVGIGWGVLRVCCGTAASLSLPCFRRSA